MKSQMHRVREANLEIMRHVLRLVWPDLKADCEIVFVKNNPHQTPDGTITLKTYRIPTPEPVGREHGQAILHYEFTGYRRRIDNNDYVYLLATDLDGIETYITLSGAPKAYQAEEYNGKCPMCSGDLKVSEPYLECVNGDYQCARVAFERIWDEWEALRKKDRDAAAAKTDQLLTDLQAQNLK
jgi:hypothetical protein